MLQSLQSIGSPSSKLASGRQKTLVKSEAQKWRGIRQRIEREAATKEDADWMLGKLQDRSTANVIVAWNRHVCEKGVLKKQ
jgi:hypothetical protein